MQIQMGQEELGRCKALLCGRDGRRKMQVGVCGRALGVGMTLEHPVGPDRRKQLGAEVQNSTG